MKYKATIPEPSAKRLVDRIIHIIYNGFDGGWMGWQATVPTGVNDIIFDVEDGYIRKIDNESCDGNYFTVNCRYSNPFGSRSETIELTPIRVEE